MPEAMSGANRGCGSARYSRAGKELAHGLVAVSAVEAETPRDRSDAVWRRPKQRDSRDRAGQAWLAIAGGRTGPRWPDSIGRAIADITDDIAKLGPALLSAPVQTSSQPASGPVKVDARMYNGAVYVIAVNSSYAADSGRGAESSSVVRVATRSSHGAVLVVDGDVGQLQREDGPPIR